MKNNFDLCNQKSKANKVRVKNAYNLFRLSFKLR